MLSAGAQIDGRKCKYPKWMEKEPDDKCQSFVQFNYPIKRRKKNYYLKFFHPLTTSTVMVTGSTEAGNVTATTPAAITTEARVPSTTPAMTVTRSIEAGNVTATTPAAITTQREVFFLIAPLMSPFLFDYRDIG